MHTPWFYFEACALIDNDEIAGIPDRLLPVLPLEISPIHQYINHGLKLFSSFFFTVRIRGSSLICFTAWKCWRRRGSALCLEAALARGMEPTTSGMKVSQFCDSNNQKNPVNVNLVFQNIFFFFLSLKSLHHWLYITGTVMLLSYLLLSTLSFNSHPRLPLHQHLPSG